MILNIVRTTLELSGYLEKIPYPRTRIFAYISVSIIAGILLSNSSRAADLPILTLLAILFGFTINAVVMLGNSSEHYLSNELKHGEELEKYYKKTLYISIHTLGVGIVAIVVTGMFQLFPDFNINVFQSQLFGYVILFELISAAVYALLTYYLIIFTIVIASTAELVKIRV